MARHPYPVHTVRLRQPLSAAALEAALAGAAPEATLKGGGVFKGGRVAGRVEAAGWSCREAGA